MKKEDTIEKILEHIFTIFPLISRELTRELKARKNLSPGMMLLMKSLHHDDQLSMSEIGCKLSIPKSHATILVDKLIQEGLAERLYDPRDRRIINVRLTDEGRAFYLDVKRSIGEKMRKKFLAMDESDLERVLLASALVRETLAEMMEADVSTEIETCGKEKYFG